MLKSLLRAAVDKGTFAYHRSFGSLRCLGWLVGRGKIRILVDVVFVLNMDLRQEDKVLIDFLAGLRPLGTALIQAGIGIQTSTVG